MSLSSEKKELFCSSRISTANGPKVNCTISVISHKGIIELKSIEQNREMLIITPSKMLGNTQRWACCAEERKSAIPQVFFCCAVTKTKVFKSVIALFAL
jgi:hypothetical protein